MKMSTFGPVGFNSEAIRESVKKSLEELGTEPKLAIIYPSVDSDYRSIVDIIKSEADVTVVGATTGGAGFTERGIALSGLVGGFIAGDSLSVTAVKAKDFKDNFESSIEKAIKSIFPSTARGNSLLMLVDAFSCDGEALVKNVFKHIPLGWRLFGGLAGDNWKLKKSEIIYDDDVFQDGGVFVYLNTDEVPSISVRHGFTPLDKNQSMEITDIEGSVLKELDNKPVIELYRKELERHSILLPGNDLVPYFASYPLGLKSARSDEYIIRAPLAIKDNAIVLAASLSKGDKVHIMTGELDNMIMATKEMTQIAIEGLSTEKPSVQLVIDCAGRKVLLGDRYKEQIKAFRISNTCPMLGFTSYGEIARFGGMLGGFHNTTCVTCVW